MNPIAQTALDRARRPTPAPVFSTLTAPTPDKQLPMPVPTGPINEYMRQQARADAIETVHALRATLASPNGVTQVINQLKRSATGRPGSHVAGILDVINFLLEHGQ
ncbi:hypothetical protein D3C77_184540 [compost metagenome]